MKYRSLFFIAAVIIGLASHSVPIFAAPVSDFQISNVNVDPVGDFVLEPGKIDVYLEPGDTVTRTIFVTNRNRQQMRFKIETEDIEGNRDPVNPITLLGNKTGPYPFKNVLLPSKTHFNLAFGERVAIPIKIQIPTNASPGGHYAAVIISNEPEKIDKNIGGARVISRLGALFFIRVKGEVKEEGQLKEIRVPGPSQFWYDKAPSTFEILFENTGTVHLVPYGTVSITNLFGETVGKISVDAYFSLPASLRYREVQWAPGFLFGRYTATAHIQRGYKNVAEIADTASVSFWVVPKLPLLQIFAALLFFILAIRYVSTVVEFRIRRSK